MTKKLLIAGLTLVAVLFFLGTGNYANGERAGTIVKIAQEGIIVKTNEVEMVKGGLNDGTGVIGGIPFYFTIKDPALLTIANDAFDENKQVKVSYHSAYLAPFSSGNDENNFADSIEIINQDDKQQGRN